MIESEPVTVVVSEKGWIRAMKGHLTDLATLTFKEGDGLKRAFHAQTTDKVLVLHDRRQVLHARRRPKLPGGRGHGEPMRSCVDMDNDQDIVTVFVHDPDRKLLRRLARRATASSCRRARSSPTPARASR